MNTLKSILRTPSIMLGVIAIVIASLGTAVAVGAATSDKAGGKISVCVKKQGGTLYQAKNCGKNKKLTWNKKGKPGAPGADGAVSGYSATQAGSVTVSANHHVQNTIVTKNLPAGSYIVNSKAVLSASDDTNDSFAFIECRLVGGTTTDTAKWQERLGQVLFVWIGSTTVSQTIAVSSATPFAVTLSCSDEHDSAQTGFTQSVSGGVITAVQTTKNQ